MFNSIYNRRSEKLDEMDENMRENYVVQHISQLNRLKMRQMSADAK